MNKAKKMTMWIMSPIMLGCLSLGLALNSSSAVAEEEQTFTVDTCEVRLNDPTGLRFTASMSDSYYQNAVAGNGVDGKTVSFGMLVIPADWAAALEEGNYIPSLSTRLEGTDITVADLTTNSLAFQNTDAQGNLVDENDTKWYIQGSLATVLYKNYNYDYTAIGFVKTTMNGTTTYAYADFDENDYHNLTEVASKSLNVAGYEDNETIQEFVKKGLCQANNIEALDALNMSYEELIESVGLSVNVNKDHVQVNDTINYSFDANGEFTEGVNSLAMTAVSSNEDVVKIEDGKLKAVGNGVATISLKNGQTYATSKTVYVGSEALALYDTYKYNSARNQVSMAVITGVGVSRAWGINKYSNEPSLVNAPNDVASAYETKFGETLSNQAYYMSLNQATLDNKEDGTALLATVTKRISEVKIALPDADYVLEYYKYIKARVYVSNSNNTTSNDFWMGTYILDKNTKVISDRASNFIAKNQFGGWMEVYFPMPTLLVDAPTMDETTYYLTLGMDLQRDWGSTEIYIGNVEFCNEAEFLSLFRSGLTSKGLYTISWTQDNGYWGRYDISTLGEFNALSADLADAYRTQFGEDAKEVLQMTPDMTKFQLFSSVAVYTCMQTNRVEYNYSDGTTTDGRVGGTALVGALSKATKVVMRVYVATNADGVSNISTMLTTQGTKPELAGAGYVAGTQPEKDGGDGTRQKPALKDVALNQWVDVELTIPAYYKENSNFELNFNLYNFKNLIDSTTSRLPTDITATIYVAGLRFV